jgi:hypothetical protein
MHRWRWLLVALLICPHLLTGCESRSSTPEKVDRSMFDKRPMPTRPPKK